jgi:dTMP kinase
VNRGSLLVFEGLDGCGKSTQLARLAERLRARGHEVVETAEPYTGGAWGPRIREMARSGRALPPREELRWFVEQRLEHVRDVITPALEAGHVVLSDRYYLSTAAYQGARGLDVGTILLESEAKFPIPELVVLLEIDPAVGLARAESRGTPGEPVFERLELQEQVAAIFAALSRDYLVRIDGSHSPVEVERLVAEGVAERTPLLG